MRLCPYCAEEIQPAAIKCKHCGEMLDAPSSPPAPEADAPPTSISRGSWVLVGTAVVLLMLVGGWVLKRHNDHVRELRAETEAAERFAGIEAKLNAASEAYKKDATDTLDEIAKIDAATETGINIMRYSELLADVNYKVRRFKDAYSGKVEGRFISYTATIVAMDSYVAAAEAWRQKNESEYGKSSYEQMIQTSWKLAGSSLQSARDALKKPEWPLFYKEYAQQVTGSKQDAEFAYGRKAAQAALESLRPPAKESTGGAALTACKSNLRNIGTALEMYSTDNAGRYPPRSELLVPRYLAAIPTCPSSGTTSYLFAMASGPDLYTVVCGGVHHSEAGVTTACYPQYTSITGVIERP